MEEPESGIHQLDESQQPQARSWTRARRGYMVVEATAQQLLMPLTAHLHEHFRTAWMPPFTIVDYFANMPWGIVIRDRG
jgi:hypothetical protein